MPAATAAEAKVSDSMRLLSGASPCRLGNSQRRLRWVRHKQLRSSRTGCGSGTSRSLLPLPMMRNTWLARSMAQTTRIHDGKARLVDRVADTAEEMTDLIFRQRVRQPLLPWRGDPFFPRTV